MPHWRSQRQNVYHTDQRTGYRQRLDNMVWDNGVLVDETQKDKAIVGSRDLNVARAVAVWRHELEPHKKLTEVVDRKADQNEILY